MADAGMGAYLLVQICWWLSVTLGVCWCDWKKVVGRFLSAGWIEGLGRTASSCLFVSLLLFISQTELIAVIINHPACVNQKPPQFWAWKMEGRKEGWMDEWMRPLVVGRELEMQMDGTVKRAHHSTRPWPPNQKP